MGFNAAWFAKAAFCALIALVAGFAGSLYLGAKLLGPVDEATKLETRSNQSIAAQTKPLTLPEQAIVQTPNDMEAPSTPEVMLPPKVNSTATSEPLPAAKGNAAQPPSKQAVRDAMTTSNPEELRLGQQERRRLRAERRKSLENANASVHRGAKKPPPQDTGNEPFFPFRF